MAGSFIKAEVVSWVVQKVCYGECAQTSGGNSTHHAQVYQVDHSRVYMSVCIVTMCSVSQEVLFSHFAATCFCKFPCSFSHFLAMSYRNINVRAG